MILPRRLTVLHIIVTASLVGFKVKAKPAQRRAEFSEPKLAQVYRDHVYIRTETHRKAVKRGLGFGSLGLAGGGVLGILKEASDMVCGKLVPDDSSNEPSNEARNQTRKKSTEHNITLQTISCEPHF